MSRIWRGWATTKWEVGKAHSESHDHTCSPLKPPVCVARRAFLFSLCIVRRARDFLRKLVLAYLFTICLIEFCTGDSLPLRHHLQAHSFCDCTRADWRSHLSPAATPASRIPVKRLFSEICPGRKTGTFLDLAVPTESEPCDLPFQSRRCHRRDDCCS